jgi:hypothetical protein
VSTKKTAWTDLLKAESNLPADEFTWTEGSNYGLDGFSFDQTLGEGLNHGDLSGLSGPITPAQTSGMSDLPDGFVSKGGATEDWGAIDLHDEVDGLDLATMLSEEEGALPMSKAARQAASLVDLAWLDPTQEQDPARLPKELRPDKPPLNSSIELEEAWGVNRRTDGLNLVPNRDKAIADYEQSIESGLPATPGVEKNAQDAAWHLKKATRMSHYGETLGSIHNYLHANLDPKFARKAFGVIAADHGLAGKVFIRASAFPGLNNGKWVQELRRIARTARYVLTDNPGIATKLGMEMVAEVPWKKALAHYQPLLQAAGYKVASVGDAKKTLQLAFLTGPKAVPVAASHKPVDVRPADHVTVAQAQEAFAQAPKPVRAVLVRDDAAQARQAAQALVVKAAKAGLITQADALRLRESSASPEAIRKAAEALARANQVPKAAVYGGEGTQFTAHQQAGRDAAWASLRQAEVAATQMKRAQSHVQKMAQAGQLTAGEAKRALQETTPEMVLKVATAFANAAGLRKEAPPQGKAAKEYAGPHFEGAPQVRQEARALSASEQAMHAAAKASGIKVAEFQLLATWLRRQMSEGMAGNDLTSLLGLRFAAPLREAGADMIRALRAEHEGLAGHLYVDAAAYASKTGTTGCEQAAPKHRTNNILYVRAMERCSGCALANANGVCTKYGKELMTVLPKNAAAFQKKMIRQADAPDQEITADLFNPQEYDLTAPTEVDVDEPNVTENIEGVLFGGLFL